MLRPHGFLADLEDHFASDHHAGKLRADEPVLFSHLVRPHRAHDLASPQHGDVVRDLENLFQLVGNKNDRATFFLDPSHDGKKALNFPGSQDRRRLIHDQDPDLAIKHTQDFHPLLLAHGKLPDVRPTVDGKAESFGEFIHGFLQSGGVEAHGTRHGEGNVLGHREIADELEMLVYHADTVVKRIPGRAKENPLVADMDLSFVGLIESGENLHERGLACAVFSEKAVNFPLENLEVDPLICRHIWEVLNNPLHQDGGSPVIRSDGHLRLSGRN